MSDAFTDCYDDRNELEYKERIKSIIKDGSKDSDTVFYIPKKVKTPPTMIRNDGKFSIYRIQEQIKNGDWIYSDLCHPTIPDISPKDGFTASGDCWQETGIHGVYDLNIAKMGLKQSYCDMVDRLNRGSIKESTRFRLVLVEISQKTTVI